MIGELYAAMDDFKIAEENFQRAVELAKELHLPKELSETYYDLGLL